ncbi:MAG: MerR family transcriptional regulator [Lewinellaceae bacterium]|nr:MerR family transcriptional regulator [Phaeodactylibacter sp.]MCB9347230.1 MerR family transcriptional regulator [Lewinellaceae bacterium]
MAVYSIKDLEKLSGIKAHTLRIWEQRYDIIEPRRTKTNIRYYLDEDLKFVLNIALLNKNGIKISKIASMTKKEIAEKVAAISEINFEYGTQLDALTISMIEMDEYKFDRIVNTNIEQLGFERTMLEIIYPFLDKLSVLWLTGSINPVQENFMSYLIRQKIIVAIDNEPLVSGKHVDKFLIYLPEGEKQELSMLFMHYLLKSRRNHVIYIGQDITLADLKDACNIHNPDYIFTMITETFAKEPVQQYVDRLAANFKDSHILLSGYQVVAQDVFPPDNISILRSLDQALFFLDTLKEKKVSR